MAADSPVRAILLDLDGTTVRTEPIWNSLVELAVREVLGRDDFVFAPDDIPRISGFSVEANIRYALQCYGPTSDDALVAKAVAVQRSLLWEFLTAVERGDASAVERIDPMPGVAAWLRHLQEAAIPVALVSAAPERKVMTELNCAFTRMALGSPQEFFAVIMTLESSHHQGLRQPVVPAARPKPDPWLYREAMRLLRVSPRDCLGFEDSEAGIASLLAAGVPPIGMGIKSPREGTVETECVACFEDFTGVIPWFRAQAVGTA